MEAHTNGADEGPTSYLRQRFETFRASDREREELLIELVQRYEQLDHKFKQAQQDLESEIGSRRFWQNDAQHAKSQLSGIKRQLGRDSFAVALIDGDGAIFHDALLAAASEGGSSAAHLLLTEIKKYLHEKDPDAAGSWSVMVNVYCHMDGLAKKLLSLHTIKNPTDLQAFARSFTISQPLFNFIDVGAGKERADHKIREMFRVFIGNIHCKHIVFGGCNDNGYLPNLDPYKHDDESAKRITLLETTPMAAGFRGLPFQVLEIPTVFRSTLLPERALAPAPAPVPPPPQITLPVRQPSAQSVAPTAASPSQTLSTPVGDSGSSWATVGKSTPAGKVISVANPKPPQQKFMLFNKDDQRLDPKLPHPDKTTMDRLHARIAKKKLCNEFHLRGRCDTYLCPFNHEPRLGEKEQLALRHKARQRSCPNELECEDIDCLMGHNCPNNPCFYQDTCYFRNTHGVDKNVKVKVYEDGSEEYP